MNTLCFLQEHLPFKILPTALSKSILTSSSWLGVAYHARMISSILLFYRFPFAVLSSWSAACWSMGMPRVAAYWRDEVSFPSGEYYQIKDLSSYILRIFFFSSVSGVKTVPFFHGKCRMDWLIDVPVQLIISHRKVHWISTWYKSFNYPANLNGSVMRQFIGQKFTNPFHYRYILSLRD